MRLVLPLLALVFFAGCDSFAGKSRELELVVDQTRYAAGDEVLVTVDNDTGSEKTYSPCLTLLGPGDYRSSGSDAFCPDIAATIRAGQSVPMRFQLPADLEAGRYALTFERGRARGVVSGRFEVGPAE